MTSVLVVGRADGVWTEYEQALKLGQFDLLMAINRAGRDCPARVQHWVSYHPHLIPHWIEQRHALGLPEHAAVLWSGIYQGQKVGVGRCGFPIQYVNSNGGSSGKLAVDVCLEGLNADRVVLCGCPLERSARYDDSTAWTEAEVYRAAWLEEHDRLKDRVRSMSGWTQELLGAPTPEWLNG